MTKNHLSAIVSNIIPFDDLEKDHIEDTLTWIKSGEPLYRITSPDIPNKHLVCYFVLFDELASKILLVDHKKAGLWLPTGGHVDIDEDPMDTVKRECAEELNCQADFWADQPIFITSTVTVPANLMGRHTDVSLWYVLKGNHQAHYNFDPGEFHKIQWFDFDKIPYEKSDPHMHRFIRKLSHLQHKR
ncbi:MAG: NUDIX hydrolase [Alphaproteobacteria bacterium]|nr:NUDIX hydrolase [Alphaproteobacteria bacterium]